MEDHHAGGGRHDEALEPRSGLLLVLHHQHTRLSRRQQGAHSIDYMHVSHIFFHTRSDSMHVWIILSLTRAASTTAIVFRLVTSLPASSTNVSTGWTSMLFHILALLLDTINHLRMEVASVVWRGQADLLL